MMTYVFWKRTKCLARSFFKKWLAQSSMCYERTMFSIVTGPNIWVESLVPLCNYRNPESYSTKPQNSWIHSNAAKRGTRDWKTGRGRCSLANSKSGLFQHCWKICVSCLSKPYTWFFFPPVFSQLYRLCLWVRGLQIFLCVVFGS